MPRRPRTLRQSLALAHGTCRHRTRNSDGGWDHAAIARRSEAIRANEAAGFPETCVWCLAGMPVGAERCPGCGEDTMPF